METDTEDNYKIVNISFTEEASIIVKAEDNDEAELAIFDSFGTLPDLKILSIEEAAPDLVEEVKVAKATKDQEEKKVIN